VVGGVEEDGVDVEVESSGSVVVESEQLGPVWAADGDVALVVDEVVESFSPLSSASAWSVWSSDGDTASVVDDVVEPFSPLSSASA
jgi:hypothetical protein